MRRRVPDHRQGEAPRGVRPQDRPAEDHRGRRRGPEEPRRDTLGMNRAGVLARRRPGSRNGAQDLERVLLGRVARRAAHARAREPARRRRRARAHALGLPRAAVLRRASTSRSRSSSVPRCCASSRSRSACWSSSRSSPSRGAPASEPRRPWSPPRSSRSFRSRSSTPASSGPTRGSCSLPRWRAMPRSRTRGGRRSGSCSSRPRSRSGCSRTT